MKNITLAGVAFAAVFVGSVGVSLAAGYDLTNGGVGQAVSKPQQFGIAVCNKGSKALTTGVPVTVTVSGQGTTIISGAPIAAGQCQYSYVNYSQLGMNAGQTYTASVVIDPQHTVIANTDNSASYSITVPGQAAMNNGNLTANAESQFPNPFAAVWAWITGLFGAK